MPAWRRTEDILRRAVDDVERHRCQLLLPGREGQGPLAAENLRQVEVAGDAGPHRIVQNLSRDGGDGGGAGSRLQGQCARAPCCALVESSALARHGRRSGRAGPLGTHLLQSLPRWTWGRQGTQRICLAEPSFKQHLQAVPRKRPTANQSGAHAGRWAHSGNGHMRQTGQEHMLAGGHMLATGTCWQWAHAGRCVCGRPGATCRSECLWPAHSCGTLGDASPAKCPALTLLHQPGAPRCP